MLSNDELGERLRTRLADEVADVTAAPDLAGILRRRYARRVLAVRAGAAAALALVAVVGSMVAAGGVGGPHAPSDPQSGPVQVYDVAAVSAYTDAALANATDFVLETRMTPPETGVTTVYRTDLQTQRTRMDSSGPGGPYNSLTITPIPDAPAGTGTVLVVDHRNRAWWTYTRVPPKLPSGAVAVPSYQDPEEIRQAINTDDLELLGTEQINGYDAWHLRATGLPDFYRLQSIDIWVDPQTYLPSRIVKTKPGGAETTLDFTWRRRTAENLATLDLTVPAGYTYHDTPIG